MEEPNSGAVELSTVTRATSIELYARYTLCILISANSSHRRQKSCELPEPNQTKTDRQTDTQQRSDSLAGWLAGWRKLCHDYRLKRLFSYALLFPLACLLLLHAPNWIELRLIEVVCGNDLEYFCPQPFQLSFPFSLSTITARRLGLIKVHSVSIRLFSERISGYRSYSSYKIEAFTRPFEALN